jgi:hypothetical protein
MDQSDILAHETPPFDEVSPNSFANQTFSPILQSRPQPSPQPLPSFSLEPPSASTASDLELRLTLDQIKHKISTLEDRLVHKERDLSFDSFALDLRSLHTRINDIEHRIVREQSPDHPQRNEMSRFIGETVTSKLNQQKRSWKLDILRKAGSIRVDADHQKHFMNEAVLEIQRSVVGLDKNQDSLSTVLMDIIFAVCRSIDSHARQKVDIKEFEHRIEETQDELSRKMSDMLKFLASKHIQEEFVEIKSVVERKIQFFEDRLDRVEEKTTTALSEMEKKEVARPKVIKETGSVQKEESKKQEKSQSTDKQLEGTQKTELKSETPQTPLKKDHGVSSVSDKSVNHRPFEKPITEHAYKQLEKKLRDLELDFTQRYETLKNHVHHLSERVEHPSNNSNSIHPPQTLNHPHSTLPAGQSSTQAQSVHPFSGPLSATQIPPADDFVRKKDLAKLKKELGNKVDCSVLEELLRHVATREELKSMIVKSMKGSNQPSTHLSDLQDRLSKIETKVKDSIESLNNASRPSAHKPSFTEELKIQFPLDRAEEGMVSSIYSQLTREFDEKLFMICTEVSSCKADLQRYLNQPFTRCGQWLWKCGSLRYGSAVPWNIETVNTGFVRLFLTLNRSRQFKMGSRHLSNQNS